MNGCVLCGVLWSRELEAKNEGKLPITFLATLKVNHYLAIFTNLRI